MNNIPNIWIHDIFTYNKEKENTTITIVSKMIYINHLKIIKPYLNQIQNDYGVSISLGKIFKMKSGGLIVLVLP